jgi:hypothetical protein
VSKDESISGQAECESILVSCLFSSISHCCSSWLVVLMWCVTLVLVGGPSLTYDGLGLWCFEFTRSIKTEATLEQLVLVYSQVIPLSKPECESEDRKQNSRKPLLFFLLGLREIERKGFWIIATECFG